MRSTTHCEVCDCPYETRTQRETHFATHFHRINDADTTTTTAEPHRRQFYCLDCAEALNIDPFEHFRSAADCPQQQINVNATPDTITKRSSAETVAADSDDSTPFVEIDALHEVTMANAADKRWPCDQCKRKFGTELERDFHIRHYHETVPATMSDDQFNCPICDRALPSQLKQVHHLREQHRNRRTGQYDCRWCAKTFKSESGIVGHAFSHRELLPYVCSICAKGFNRLRNLQGHYATHNDEQAYACKLCAKTFKTMQLRKKHWRSVHIAEKPLQCDDCDKRFKDHSDLRRHRWTHGGYEKKFQCDLCERKFFEAKLLRIHMRTHTKASSRPGATARGGGGDSRIIEIEMVSGWYLDTEE